MEFAKAVATLVVLAFSTLTIGTMLITWIMHYDVQYRHKSESAFVSEHRIPSIPEVLLFSLLWMSRVGFGLLAILSPSLVVAFLHLRFGFEFGCTLIVRPREERERDWYRREDWTSPLVEKAADKAAETPDA